MAMAAGLRTGNGIYFVRSDEVWEQSLHPWTRARVRFQQHQRDAGSRAGLCAVVCSTSGRSNQFARKKLKGTGSKAVDKRNKKDVHLVEELRKFIAEHNLPSNQLPSIKELMSKGRLDLANVVRSRGYKAVSRMLAHPKYSSGTTSGSSSDSEVAVGGKLSAADVALDSMLVGVAAVPEPAGDLEAFASEGGEGDGCSEDLAGSTGTVTGGETDFVPAVQQDGTTVRGEFTNAQPVATFSQEDEDGTRAHPQEPVGMFERLARLREAVTELSLQDRAKMFVKTGEPSYLHESPVSGPVNGSDTPVQEVGKSAGQGRMREMPGINYSSAELPDLQSDNELLDSDFEDTESDDEFLEGTNAQPVATFSQEDEDGTRAHPQEPVGMLEEGLARLREAVTELSLQERAKMFVKTGEPSYLHESPVSDPVNGSDTPVQEVGKSAGQGRMREMPGINYSSAELPDLQSDDELLDLDFEDTESDDEFLDLDFEDTESDNEFLDGSVEEFWEISTVQDRVTTEKDSNGAVSKEMDSYSDSWAGDDLGVREESIIAQKEMEQILSILAKQREIGRLMQRDKDMDSQFVVDAQAELDKIKSVLQSREAKTATLRQALLEAKAELSLVKAKAAADMEEAAKMLAEKDALLQSAQLALVRLKKVSLEWWGEGTKVELAGSFNGWQHFFAFEPDLSSEISDFDGSPGPMLWCLDIWLYPGVYEIKFIVDGIWTLDHRREMVMRTPNMQNNLLRVDC